MPLKNDDFVLKNGRFFCNERYEFASHVPWMMRWPKNAGLMGQARAASWKRGAIIDTAVVELRDIFPTMLDAIGLLNGFV